MNLSGGHAGVLEEQRGSGWLGQRKRGTRESGTDRGTLGVRFRGGETPSVTQSKMGTAGVFGAEEGHGVTSELHRKEQRAEGGVGRDSGEVSSG